MDTVLSVLRDAGFATPEKVSPQIYIGNTGATLKTLTSAMSIFPNNGVRRRPFLIRKIESAEHEVIYSTPVLESDVLPASVAQTTGRLLQRVMSEGTAASARSEFGFKGTISRMRGLSATPTKSPAASGLDLIFRRPFFRAATVRSFHCPSGWT